MNKKFLIPCLIMTALSACDMRDDNHGNERGKGKTAAERQTLVIGVIPERNIFDQMQEYTPIAEYISKRISVKVELKALVKYNTVVDNFKDLGLDGAFLGSFSYFLAHTTLGVEVLARPEHINGTSTYDGVLFVRKDSGIKNADDMQGKVFAFVDRATTAGYLFPLVYFKENGITDYSRYFSETYFSGTHEDVIYDVLNKRADIGAVKNTIFTWSSDQDNRIVQELIVIARSPSVPSNALAVRKELGESLKSELKKTLLGMHKDKEGKDVLTGFGANKFIDTNDSDYSELYTMLQKAGVRLENYLHVIDK